MQLLTRLIFHRAAPRQIRYLERADYSNASRLSAQVLSQLEDDFIVGPPLTLHMPNSSLFAAVWSMGRECLTVGRKGRPLREAVAAAISQLNACPYCTDVHTAMLYSLDRSDAVDMVRSGSDTIVDVRIRRAVEWALATLTPGSPALASPPFSAEEAPQVLGTAVCFHYINRMVNIFLDSSPFPRTVGRFRKSMTQLFGAILGGRIATQAPPSRTISDGGQPEPPVASGVSVGHEFSLCGRGTHPNGGSGRTSR